ncbi:unnamed protein product, partial [Larinioides sclopetarius]
MKRSFSSRLKSGKTTKNLGCRIGFSSTFTLDICFDPEPLQTFND